MTEATFVLKRQSKVFYMQASRLNAGDTLVDIDGREWPITEVRSVGGSVRVFYEGHDWEFYDKSESVQVKRS